MYYIRHYSIQNSRTLDLKNILETQYNISCIEHPKPPDYPDYPYHDFVFDVPENHPKFNEIERILPPCETYEEIEKRWDDAGKYGWGNLAISQSVSVLYFAVYSKEEFDSAKWLTVRSSFSKVLNYDQSFDDVFDEKCFFTKNKNGKTYARHLVLSRPHIFNKKIKWGTRRFASSSMGEEILFCDDYTRNMLETNGIKGIDYKPVYNSKSGEARTDLFQLSSMHIVPNEAIVPVDMDTYTCEQCGMKVIGYRNTRGTFGIAKGSLDENVDVYKTLPLFVADAIHEPSGGREIYIVSQRFYQFVKKNHMDRALMFRPIVSI